MAASFLLAGCTWEGYADTRPVVKIGLIAPFEGLYRESGYEALAAMRAAIADSPLPGEVRIDILPLALDDSADPGRSGRVAAKLLADPAVAAVVGPLFPATGAAVGEELARADLAWMPVYAVDPIYGYMKQPENEPNGWAIGLVQRVAEHCRAEGCTRLVMAGDPTGFPSLPEAEWTEIARLPVVYDYTQGQELQVDDGVLWLGLPHAGADYLTHVRRTQPDVPFWLATGFGLDIFARRTELSGPIFWTSWLTDEYDGWAAAHPPGAPTAFQIYRATQAALAASLNASPPAPGPIWTVRLFRLNPDGSSQAP